MLQLIISPYWRHNRDHCLHLIRESVKAGQERHILLVPEQFSHDYEGRLCRALGDTASRHGEVLSFSRLANRVFSRYGGLAVPTLDGGGRLLAMAAAVQQLRPRLKSYAAAGGKPEFLTSLITAVDEFKSCRITAPMLRAAAGEAEGLLAQKAEELALLLEGYNAICDGFGQDPRDRMTKLLELLELGDFGESHRFYIDGFSDFTAQETEIIRYLMEVSPQVTVCLTADRIGTDTPGMELAGETAGILLRHAARTGTAYQILTPPCAGLTLPETLAPALLSGTLAPNGEYRRGATAHRLSDVQAECAFVAAKIRELGQRGVRYRDMGIVMSDPIRYTPVLRRLMRRYNIPAYFAGTEEILHKSVVHTILTALEAVTGPQEQGDMLRYLKSILSPLTPSQCDRLENYAVAWGIRGTAWEKPFTKHPEGLGQSWTQEDTLVLEELNRLRSLGCGPLGRLRKNLTEGQTVAHQLEGIYTFLQETGVQEQLEKLTRDFYQAGDSRSAQEQEQLWDILMGAMEQMHALLGSFSLEPEVLVRLMKLLLTQYHVGTIPQALDCVIAGGIAPMRRHEVSHLFLLGAQEGYLPAGAEGGMVLTESERESLVRLGLPLQANLYRQLEQELGSIYAALQAPRDGLHLTMGAGQCAPAYRRLCTLLEKDPEEITEPSPEDTVGDLWDGAAAWLQLQKAPPSFLKEAGAYLGSRLFFDPGRLTRDTVEALYGKELRLSASQVDKAASCRFAYFMRYGLGLRERKEITLDPAEFGTFVHDVLEHTAREITERGGFSQVSLEETEAVAEKYAQRYYESRFRDLEDVSPRQGYLFRRNMAELRMVVSELWRELSQSDFQPEGFEVAFGPQGDMPPVTIPNAPMPAYLRGFVDRLDIYKKDGKTYVRVVDYKTGRKSFDYCDVLCGLGLQMLIYLFALEEGGETLLGCTPEAAGVLYFPARCPLEPTDGPEEDETVARQREKALRRQGLLLRDEDILTAMDGSEAYRLLPVKVSKDGALSGDLATKEQFAMLKAYVMATMEKLVAQIHEGELSPNPYFRGDHDACRYCEYAPCCHLDLWGQERIYQKVGPEEFWQTVEKEVTGHGK